MSEQWRPVVGWEGYYEVSDHGRVRSVARTVVKHNGHTQRWKSRIRKDGPHGNRGHRGVTLWRNGTMTMRTVHSLVLEAFVCLRPDGMHACHEDGDPSNNHVRNLRWDSQAENNRDISRHGHHHNGRKTHCRHGHEFTPENTIVRSDGKGRHCRICRNKANRESKARRRERERTAA